MSGILGLSEAMCRVGEASREANVFLLTRRHVVSLLEALQSGSIGFDEVAEWAEYFDVNEDVELECDDLADVIFELSSPEINGVPTAQRVREIIELMSPGD